MAWCRQATSHYPSHCEPRSISPHGVFQSQWVNPICFSTWLDRKSLWCITHLGETIKQLYAIHLDIGASRRFYNFQCSPITSLRELVSIVIKKARMATKCCTSHDSACAKWCNDTFVGNKMTFPSNCFDWPLLPNGINLNPRMAKWLHAQ